MQTTIVVTGALRVNPMCPVDSSNSTLWTGSLQQKGCLVSSLLLSCLIGILVFNAKQIQISCHILLHLIGAYTVCQDSFLEMLSI